MDNLTLTQIEAIRRSTLLAAEVERIISDSALLTAPLASMTASQLGYLHDACSDALNNESPIVKEYLAKQDKGVYPIEILGVPGAYFIFAPEYDRMGVFSTISDAIDYVESNFGEFLVNSEAVDADEDQYADDTDDDSEDPRTVTPDVEIEQASDASKKGGYKLRRVRLADVAPNHPFAQEQISFGGRHPSSSINSSETPNAESSPKDESRTRVKPWNPKDPAEEVSATICVQWGYDLHSIHLTPRNWRRVKSCKPLRIRGKGYHYEGEFFWDYWHFEGGLDGDLCVCYGSDGGDGFVGTLRSADITEHRQPRKPRR